MAVTTKDLARECGVSRATVTRALHGTGRISDETKDRILSKAAEMGYQPDLLARSLVSGRSMTIGVVVCDLKNFYFSKMIDAMEPVARRQGYLLHIALHANDEKKEEKIIRTLAGHKVDGLIIYLSSRRKEKLEMLSRLPFPVLQLAGKPCAGLGCIGIDERGAARDAVNYILSKGYEEVYYVFPEDLEGEREETTHQYGHLERYEGYQDAIEGKCVRSGYISGSGYVEQARRLAQEAIRQGRRAAFFCSGDPYAAAILMGMMREGYVAGRDYGVMGIDCMELFQMLPEPLTTVDNHVEVFGEQAVRNMVDMIVGGERERVVELPYSIVEGKTV